MSLKEYFIPSFGNHTVQWDENERPLPSDAVPVEEATGPDTKAKRPANKARKPSNK